MATGKNPVQIPSGLEFPLLTQPSNSTGPASKPTPVSAASLLASSKAAKSQSSSYKTLSAPIDRIVSPFLRPGYGLQISGPPGTYVEQLAIGLIKSVAGAGKEVILVDMQNKIKADTICGAIDDEGADRVHYHTLHTLPELASLLMALPKFLSEHPQISLLVFSSLSFPFQTEPNFSTRRGLLDRVRDLIVKLSKQHQLVTVITSTMSMHFENPDGSRGTFDDDSKALLTPQIDISCKSISSLILSRDDRQSGRAVLTPATNQPKLRAEFDFVDLELRDKVP